VIVVAEGAVAAGGREITVDAQKDEFGHARLGGIGAWLAEKIRNETDHDARSVALGHPQRGGPPSPVDRHMGWLYGLAAVEAVRGSLGQDGLGARRRARPATSRWSNLADAVARSTWSTSPSSTTPSATRRAAAFSRRNVAPGTRLLMTNPWRSCVGRSGSRR
jgi:6-phosphofructokinase